MPTISSTTRAALFVCLLLAAGCGDGGGENDPWLFLDGDLSRLPRFTDAEAVHFSSHDRTGGNDDGFSGLFSRIRIDENREHVLAELEGPGCVRRIWMTWPGGSTNLRVYIDGREIPIVDLPVDEFFSGGHAPFVAPWTGGDREFGGVDFSYTPIPFEKGVKITTTRGIRFYQIDIHRYPEGTKVESFSMPPSDELLGRIEEAKAALAALPEEASVEGPWTVEKGEKDEEIRVALDLGPGEAKDLWVSEDKGVIREFRISVKGGADALRETHLEAYWDGEAPEEENDRGPSIHTPLADLFGSGIAPAGMRTAAVIASGGAGILRFPMPFESARLRLENHGAERAHVDAALLVGPAKGLKELGRFHARSRASESAPGEPVPLLFAQGEGHFVGTHLTMRSADGTSRFLEGDEWIYIDTDTLPRHIGTGTEDYFNGGWYFARGASELPFHAVPFQSDAFAPYLSAVRHHLADRIPFRSRFAFLFEHGESRNAPGATYQSLTLWYQREPHRADPATVGPTRFLRRAPVFPEHMISSVEEGAVEQGAESAARPLGEEGGRWVPFFTERQLLTSSSPEMQFRFPAPAEGRYALRVVFGKGAGFGDLKVLLDGQTLFPALSASSDTLVPVVLSPKTRIGLSEGEHRIVIRAGSGEGNREAPSSSRSVRGLIHGVLLEPTAAFADRWLVVGPFEDYAGQRFDYSYPPEEEVGKEGIRWARSYRGMGGETIGWEPAAAGPKGFVDLREAIGPGTHRIAYAVTWVKSPRARRALFSLGSDDGAQVWLNGERIWRNPAHRGWASDQDRFIGNLRRGRNEILVKVNQGIAGWGFSLRLSDARGDLSYYDRPF